MCFLHLTEDAIDLEIGGRHRRSVLLRLNVESLLRQVYGPLAGDPNRARDVGEFSIHRIRVTGLRSLEKYELRAPTSLLLTP